MFISSPLIIDNYVCSIPHGSETHFSTMRNDLAIGYSAGKTCPVTSGIFLRIVAEAAYIEWEAGIPIEKIAPFWRIVAPTSKLAKKLSCGIDFIIEQRQAEKLNSSRS